MVAPLAALSAAVGRAWSSRAGGAAADPPLAATVVADSAGVVGTAEAPSDASWRKGSVVRVVAVDFPPDRRGPGLAPAPASFPAPVAGVVLVVAPSAGGVRSRADRRTTSRAALAALPAMFRTAAAALAPAFVADAFVADAFVADAFVADAFVADAFVADAFVAGGLAVAACFADAFVAGALAAAARFAGAVLAGAFAEAVFAGAFAAAGAFAGAFFAGAFAAGAFFAGAFAAGDVFAGAFAAGAFFAGAFAAGDVFAGAFAAVAFFAGAALLAVAVFDAATTFARPVDPASAGAFFTAGRRAGPAEGAAAPLDPRPLAAPAAALPRAAPDRSAIASPTCKTARGRMAAHSGGRQGYGPYRRPTTCRTGTRIRI
jgi:hypothetical protein